MVVRNIPHPASIRNHDLHRDREARGDVLWAPALVVTRGKLVIRQEPQETSPLQN